MRPRSVQPYERRRDVRALLGVAGLFGRAWQRVEVHGRCRVPDAGPALVVANHTAGLDPLVIQSTLRRPITWVMTSEFYDLPSLRGFLRHVEMIRIDRTGRDAGAWREALRVLGEGRVVGVFPEGRIEKTRDLMPLGVGAATLALRGNADVYPAYLDGRQRGTPMLHTYLFPQEPMVAWGDVVPRTDGAGRRVRPEALTASIRVALEALRCRHTARRRRGRSLLATSPA